MRFARSSQRSAPHCRFDNGSRANATKTGSSARAGTSARWSFSSASPSASAKSSAIACSSGRRAGKSTWYGDSRISARSSSARPSWCSAAALRDSSVGTSPFASGSARSMSESAPAASPFSRSCSAFSVGVGGHMAQAVGTIAVTSTVMSRLMRVCLSRSAARRRIFRAPASPRWPSVSTVPFTAERLCVATALSAMRVCVVSGIASAGRQALSAAASAWPSFGRESGFFSRHCITSFTSAGHSARCGATSSSRGGFAFTCCSR